ncbi:hypothetical protein AB7M18_000892 [Pseudomonas viridiflava]|uniref:DUF4189 domain-containing protein n=1 Tax=Pseudomonas syringae TaxID=317 RepID=UPI000BB5B412|nr:DUF4189 domain-containing protein [Pseudomonas syringae]PBP84107.1 hypothetical protein CCL22_08920 [Pseudomonas syringae]
MMKIGPITFISLMMLGMHVEAQTRCPMGAQAGSMQCLPDDPQYNQSAPPRPTGEWIKTWGAIAGSDATGESGAVVGKFSEGEAREAALRLCAEGEAKDCKVNLVFRNQCAAVVSSKTDSFFQGAESEEIALDLAMKSCEKLGSPCSVIYSACTDPVFKKY